MCSSLTWRYATSSLVAFIRWPFILPSADAGRSAKQVRVGVVHYSNILVFYPPPTHYKYSILILLTRLLVIGPCRDTFGVSPIYSAVCRRQESDWSRSRHVWLQRQSRGYFHFHLNKSHLAVVICGNTNRVAHNCSFHVKRPLAMPAAMLRDCRAES